METLKGSAINVRHSTAVTTTTSTYNSGTQSSSVSMNYTSIFVLANRAGHLSLDIPIFINEGDQVLVVGTTQKSGVFVACAYKNQTTNVVRTASEFSQRANRVDVSDCYRHCVAVHFGFSLRYCRQIIRLCICLYKFSSLLSRVCHVQEDIGEKTCNRNAFKWMKIKHPLAPFNRSLNLTRNKLAFYHSRSQRAG